MAKKFSVLAWNIEHFKNETNRTKRIAERIKEKSPDVFAVLETEDINIMTFFSQHFADYNFYITDGPESQEIMIGCRKNKFDQVVFTQKREFKVYNPYLRPGALLSVKKNNEWFNLLFLHNDSGTDAGAFGNRFEMMSKIEKMITALNNAAQASHLIIAGDFNTMGMSFPRMIKAHQKVNMEDEISGLAEIVARNNLSFATKQFSGTWLEKEGGKTSDLDHVIYSNGIRLNPLGQSGNTAYQVEVKGWQGLSKPDQKKYLDDYSDHCLLYWEVA